MWRISTRCHTMHSRMGRNIRMGILSSRMVSNNLSSLPMLTLQYTQLECHAFKDSNPVRWGGMVRKLLHIFQTDVSRRYEEQGCHFCSCLLWACRHATQVTCQPDLLDGSVGFTQGKLGCSSSFPPPPMVTNFWRMRNWSKCNCEPKWIV
jgi:hypothetical protein